LTNKNKAILLIVIIVGLIGFQNNSETKSSTDSSSFVPQNSTISDQNKCAVLIAERNALEETAKRMATDAMELQRGLLRSRLDEIVNSHILNRKDTEVLREYISYDLKKIVSEKSDAFGEAFKRNMELRPGTVTIINKLIKLGELEPYWFSEVQQMGQTLRSKFQDSQNIMRANSDCFEFSSEIDKLINEATKNINNGEEYNGWIAIKTADELVDSIL
jgi:hypothetical protein